MKQHRHWIPILNVLYKMLWTKRVKGEPQSLCHTGPLIICTFLRFKYFNAKQIFENRLSAIRNADRILFIEKGKIVEDGTHDELIKQQGSYYNMMRSNNIDNDNILQNTLDVDNENLPSSKLVEKQMFAESKQIQDNQTGSTVFC